MKRVISILVIVILIINISGCNLRNKNASDTLYYNTYSENSYEYYEEGYQCDILNVLKENDDYYVVCGALPIVFDDSSLYEHYSLNKISESGELIRSYPLGDINRYAMADIRDGVFYYVTFDGRLIKLDLNTGSFIDSVRLDGQLCGVTCLDDGYVVLSPRQASKYDYDNNLVASVNNDEWGIYLGMGTFYSEDGSCYLISSDGMEYRYYIVDFENSRSEFVFTTRGLGKVTDCCYKQYVFNIDGEMRLDFEEDTFTTLIDWNKVDIQPQKCGLAGTAQFVAFDDENFAKIYLYEDGSSQLLIYSYLETAVYDKHEIVIGGYDLLDDPSLNWAVYKYNKSQDEYRAVIEDYADIFGYNDDPVTTKAAMIEYFNDGNSPDVFYGNWFDYESLYFSGMTQDMVPYMSDNFEEAFSEITDNVRELMLNDSGECFRMFASYQMEGYAGSDVFLHGDSNISIEELLEISEVNGALPINFAFTSQIVYSAIAYSIRSMDELREEDIALILEYAYEYGYQDMRSSYFSHSLDRNTVEEIVLWTNGIFEPAAYSENEKRCNSELVYVGFPSVNGSVHLVVPQGQVAVSSSTACPEECCELISFLLDEDVQIFNAVNCQIPVSQSVLEFYCDASVDHSLAGDRTVYNYLELFDEISAECKARFLGAVYSADAVLMYDWGMNDIIEDEVETYYTQGRSVEEIAASLKNRLDLYMAENYG